jgi:hypothetical protein
MPEPVTDCVIRINVPVPMSMVAELEAMAVAHALSVPQFLRSIVAQHVEHARVRRAAQQQPPKRRKGRVAQ